MHRSTFLLQRTTGAPPFARYTPTVLFLEEWARPLLLVHGVAAAVLVGASTHHLIWCRHYLRGRFQRARQERRFALVSACAFVVTFVLGNLLYPTYKVRVRAEYLDEPTSIAAETTVRREAAARDLARSTFGRSSVSPAPATVRSRPADLGWVGRLFDVKEHWVALGCGAALALLALSRFAHPSEDRRWLVAYLGLSLLVCATAWTGAIVGLLVSTFRSVGGAA